jgi:hypothetical protein
MERLVHKLSLLAEKIAMSSLFCHSNFVVVGLRKLLEALSFSVSEEYEF